MQYHLKTIRKSIAYGETCLSASIWHGDRQIGCFRDCPDTGKPVFDFKRSEDQQAFTHYIETWWSSLKQIASCDFHSNDPFGKDDASDLPLATKMRCWISSNAGEIDSDSTWKWPSRDAKNVMRSFQRFSARSLTKAP